jgi:lipid II:glycine glycyltransferase (peptidoglycan interpeptide bridge formation enzyme)
MIRMVTIRLATEEDKDEWNKVAQQSPEATYAHTWEWGKAIEHCIGVKSIYLLGEDKGEVVGIYPAFLRLANTNLPFINKFKILYSPLDLLWDYGGPCILPNTNTNVLKELIVRMEQFADKNNVLSLHISPFKSNVLNTLISNGYRTSERLTSIIDLLKNEDNLLKNIARDAKRGINKAQKKGVHVEHLKDGEILEAYTCLKVVHEHHKAYLPPLSFFEAIQELQMANFFSAKLDGKVIGVSLCLCFKDVCTERYRSSLFDYRKFYPDNLLVWHSILDAKKKGFKIFDFGGIPSNKNDGIYFFKSRWGGEIKKVDWCIKDVTFPKIRCFIRGLRGRL